MKAIQIHGTGGPSVFRYVCPLEEAAKAHRAISGRHTPGKVVLIT